MGELKVWWLTVYDPDQAIASRVAGAFGTDGHRTHISWMPLDKAASAWAQTLADAGIDSDSKAIDVDALLQCADGIARAAIDVHDLPADRELVDAVEAVLDRALGAPWQPSR